MDPIAGWVLGAGLMTLGALVRYVTSQAASGSIRRNSAVGIRTKATMSSDRAWAAAHAAASPMLTATYLTAYAMGVIAFATVW
ncbi:SdpI family protein [Streptomyces sp. NPDC047097]|uniref:SdpI family protein n=1 Tax=Streptomyces sp. NPDC047097 TaxID=3155260 RepID=UPI0033F07D61